MRAAAATAVLLIGLALTPAGASALEPGVHEAPGSPASHEYAFPLKQARAVGQSSGESGGSGKNPEGQAFGAGIRPPGGSSPAGGAGAKGHARAGANGRTTAHTTGTSATATSATDAAALRAAAHTAAGSDSLTVILIGSIATLMLGGGGGLALRRARGATPSA